LQGQDELRLERQEELYVGDRHRIAILGMDPAKMLLESRALLLRGFSTNHLRHGKSKVSGIVLMRGDTPRPEAADRPAPHKAITRLAFARVSRNDCSSCGVMIVTAKLNQASCKQSCWVHYLQPRRKVSGQAGFFGNLADDHHKSSVHHSFEVLANTPILIYY